MNGPSKETLHTVWTRDEGCCVRCGSAITGQRGIDWSLHHRAPRGSGGTRRAWVNEPANLLILDGSGTTGCHGWVEANRTHARNDGFLIFANGILTAEDVPIRHALYGWVYLDDLGGWKEA